MVISQKVTARYFFMVNKKRPFTVIKFLLFRWWRYLIWFLVKNSLKYSFVSSIGPVRGAVVPNTNETTYLGNKKTLRKNVCWKKSYLSWLFLTFLQSHFQLQVTSQGQLKYLAVWPRFLGLLPYIALLLDDYVPLTKKIYVFEERADNEHFEQSKVNFWI